MATTVFTPETAARKSNCFSSSWWPIKREPNVLSEDGELVRHGRPIRYVLLAKHELYQLGYTGQVTIRGAGEVTT